MRIALIRHVRTALLIVMLCALAVAGWSAWTRLRAGDTVSFLSDLLGPPKTLVGDRVGIVAGHSGYDSGAVCDDGLTEGEVNAVVADLVRRRLEARGATVDLLEEFDPALDGYLADAFVSIHADSCDVDLTGFKVAGSDGQSGSEALVDCLWDRYEAATHLSRSYDTITTDMTDYHAFRSVSPWTPAAIIEIGFLRADRRLLTRGQGRIADGIISGVECFLAGD